MKYCIDTSHITNEHYQAIENTWIYESLYVWMSSNLIGKKFSGICFHLIIYLNAVKHLNDEKMITCNNVEQKWSLRKQNEAPSIPLKVGQYPKKVMFCIW